MPAINPDPAAVRVDDTAFVAPGVALVGDVEVGAEASLWFGVVARGDVAAIRVGPRSNVQDNSVLHADPGHPCQIGEGVTVGHRCIVHGCTVEDGALIGMGSVVMNGAVIGAHSLVGAGALVTEGKVFPPRSLILGSPAKRVRELTDEEVAALALSAERYVVNGQTYRAADLAGALR